MFRSFVISCLILASTLAAAGRTRPHYGQVLRVDTQADPWQVPDGMARRLVLDGLTRVDESGAVLPALATRWESQSDDHRWQFWLRPGVHFHDGTALDADIVVTALGGSCHAACPWTSLRAVGNSVVFTSQAAMRQLPAELARGVFLIANPNVSGGADGTGPFRVGSLAGGVLSLEANEDSWAGRPFLDTIEILGRRSIRDQWLDLSVGRTDIAEVPPEYLGRARQDHLSLLASQPADLLLLSLQTGGALRDDQLRQAVAFAVDRTALHDVIYQKQGEITASLLPNAMTGYAFLFPTERDLARSQQHRAGATGATLTLSTENADPSMRLAADRIALNLKEAGINVRVAQTANPSQADLLLQRLHLEGTTAQAGLEQMLLQFGSSALADADDPAALYRAERDFLRLHQQIPLLYLPRAYALSERVRDLRMAPDGTLLLADASIEDAK